MNRLILVGVMIGGLELISAATHSHAATLSTLYSFENNTVDSSVNGNTGTITGTTQYVAGRFGSAIHLDTGALVKNASPALLPISGAFSMNVWLKLDAVQPNLTEYVGFGNQANLNTGAERGILTFNSNQFGAWGSAADAPSGFPFSTDSTWHMYTVTFDGTTLRTYKDGVAGGTANVSMTMVTPVIHVGGPSTPDFGRVEWTGSVDEFSIWTGALTAGEVQSLVPEPNAITLLGMGFVIFARFRRGRSSSR